MKNNFYIGVLFIASLISCNKKTELSSSSITTDIDNVVIFGEPFVPENAKNEQEMLVLYQNLKEGDTISTQFKSEIISTCKKKGCWMRLAINDTEDVTVRFKDYGFFVPKEGANGKQAIVNGKAFLAITSVNELKNEAKDAGQSKEQIDNIVAPKKVKLFVADGVLIQQ